MAEKYQDERLNGPRKRLLATLLEDLRFSKGEHSRRSVA